MTKRFFAPAAIGLAASLCPVAALPAMAADLGPSNSYYEQSVTPAIYDWTGFYVGAHAGYGSASASSVDLGGFVGGGQVGYNLQSGQFVMGLEGDLTASGIDKSKAASYSLDWLGSARARAGIALDRLLIYGTGGFGFGGFTYDNGVSRDDRWSLGWVLGVGAEAALSRNWTARLEAFHYDLGREDYRVFGGPVSIKTTATIVRAGVNYRF